jgi:hypothetical protein
VNERMDHRGSGTMGVNFEMTETSVQADRWAWAIT